VVPALTVILIILLWMIIGWQSMLRLVLYCNLIVTFNKTGRRLKKYFNSFNAAMLVMTGTAAFGLALGWMLGNL
jgi:ABC-type sulfate transport system permease component